MRALLERHFDLMRAQSPPESCHVLPSDALMSEDVVLLGARDGRVLVGVGALKNCGTYGEIKSMHTASKARGRGVARRLLMALIAEARVQGLPRLNLETGSGADHAAARGLYSSAGFTACPPFGVYRHDPLSHFMTLPL